MHALDLSLFYAIFSLSGRSTGLDALIVFFGTYYLYVILGIYALFVYTEIRAHRMERVRGYIVAVVAALTARFGVAEVIRLWYHRPRPFLALHLPHLLSDATYSFPSGHTIFLCALATAVLYVHKKFAYVLFASAAVVALARVAGGVHYPSDIVGGAVLGMLTGYVVRQGYKYVSSICV